MSTTRRRRADAERNIAAIIDATRELLAKGADPTMSEIALAAGVGRVTLYAHFPTREALVKAVVEQALGETDEILDTLDLDTGPVDAALDRLIRAGWQKLDGYRRLRTVALRAIGPHGLRHHHDRVLGRVERLVARGQQHGVVRTDMPGDWLVAMFYAVIHAAADEVDAGRLPASSAPTVLTKTLWSLFRA